MIYGYTSRPACSYQSHYQSLLSLSLCLWIQEEPLDVNYLPVLVDLQLKSPSLDSLDTVLNELDCSSTYNHTKLPGDSVQTTNPTYRINNSTSCVSDVGQNCSDTESTSEEHLQEPNHTTRVIEESKFKAADNFHPHVATSEGCLTQALDSTANIYNYSLDSREYVLVSSLSYTHSGGSASTTYTTIDGSHCEDPYTQTQNNNNIMSCDKLGTGLSKHFPL